MVVILGGVAAYFVYFRDTVYQGFKKEFKASGQPVSIEMELDSENVSILHTDKTGGLLSKGDISLEVPEDALPGRESIVATKITNLKGLPEGWEFVDGYNFTPDGTTFAKPAVLTYYGADAPNLYAFKVEDGRLSRLPLFKQDGALVTHLTSFSGAVFIEVSRDLPYVTNPNDVEKRANEIIANIVAENKETVTDEQIERIKKVLRAWYNASVKNHLEVAKENEQILRDAARELLDWWKRVQIFGLDDEFAQEIERAHDLLAEGFKNAITLASEHCVADRDITQASAVMQWTALAQLLGYEDRPGFAYEDLKQHVHECARFELKIESRMDANTDFGDSYITLTGEAMIELKDWEFTGEGTVTEGPWVQTGEGGCTYTVDPNTYNIKIGPTPFLHASGKTGANVNLLLDLTALDEHHLYYRCSLGSNSQMTVGWPGSFWLSDFDELHEDLNLRAYLECECYAISDWEYVGKDGIVARKTLKGSKTSAFGTSTRGTTEFVLYHRPVTSR